jgi:2-polyprenyl-6-methoxyphenol hydroxylase-like FAD-dependent oxidoreductase
MLNASRFRMRRQVLIVGANPIGLVAALRLRDAGVDVRVIDALPAPSNSNDVVVLHPHSLSLLQDLGLSTALFWLARKVPRVAIYSENERRAVLELPIGWRTAPGAATLPRDVLEQALTRELARRGVTVEWGSRLSKLYQDDRAVWGSITHHYALGNWTDISPFQADFVVGADGTDSAIRRLVGIDLEPIGPRKSYALFEACLKRPPAEAALVLGNGTSSCLYPVRDDLFRFAFELREPLDQEQPNESLSELSLERLPWLDDQPSRCERAVFTTAQGALAARFGVGRVWLAGDAVHSSSPLADRGLNAGLSEVSELVLRMSERLKRPTLGSFADAYHGKRIRQWRELLSPSTPPASGDGKFSWVQRHTRQLLDILPAAEHDLDELMRQLNHGKSAGPSPAHVTA